MDKKTNSSLETISSGKRANRTGNNLERFVEDSLIRNGYTHFPNKKKQVFSLRKKIGGKQYSRQVPVGKSIYETVRNCDFLVMNKAKFPDGLVIECKWQQAAGSVDEKYPFLYFNITKCGVPTIVVIDGGGYKESAVRWLKSMVNPRSALIGVWDMREFQQKVNNGFLG